MTPVGTAMSGGTILLMVLATLVARDRGRGRSTWDRVRARPLCAFIAFGALFLALPEEGWWRPFVLLCFVCAVWAFATLVRLERSR
jgi:hypothetical protein